MSEPFPSISSLVPHLRDDDYESWQRLFERFRTGMLSKARRLLRSSKLKKSLDPEDLVQDAFQKAWLGFSSFRGENTAQFAKWLLTILRNTFLNHCRSKNKTEKDGADLEQVAGTDETPSEKLAVLEQEARLHACIAELSPDEQRLLAMKNFEGLTFREIAEQLNSKASTVCGMHSRAMQRLSKLMQSESYYLVIRKNSDKNNTDE